MISIRIKHKKKMRMWTLKENKIMFISEYILQESRLKREIESGEISGPGLKKVQEDKYTNQQDLLEKKQLQKDISKGKDFSEKQYEKAKPRGMVKSEKDYIEGIRKGTYNIQQELGGVQKTGMKSIDKYKDVVDLIVPEDMKNIKIREKLRNGFAGVLRSVDAHAPSANDAEMIVEPYKKGNKTKIRYETPPKLTFPEGVKKKLTDLEQAITDRHETHELKKDAKYTDDFNKKFRLGVYAGGKRKRRKTAGGAQYFSHKSPEILSQEQKFRNRGRLYGDYKTPTLDVLRDVTGEDADMKQYKSKKSIRNFEKEGIWHDPKRVIKNPLLLKPTIQASMNMYSVPALEKIGIDLHSDPEKVKKSYESRKKLFKKLSNIRVKNLLKKFHK
jgi:hypothetical protein